MKTLLVVRHAKSSWSDTSLRDFDRPLNKRGLYDAPRMGAFLREKGIEPHRLISSPAKRALTTAQLIAAQLEYAEGDIDAESDFYGASVHETMSIVHSFLDQWSTVLIFGHNPTTTSFVNWLTNAEIDNVPTCGVAHVRLHADQWRLLGDAKAELAAFYIPKELPA